MALDQIEEVLRSATQPLNSARHLPGYIYSSPEVYALEKERIFMVEWLCIARDEEIERPGDCMAFKVTDEPVAIVRDEQGQLRAFRNVCSRCGGELTASKGDARRFVCQDDGASYGPDVLQPVHLALWQGWVFINFADSPAPFAEFIGIADRDFGFLRQGECRLGDKFVADMECNWKLAVENLADIYHLKVLHAKSNGRFFTPEDVNVDFRGSGQYTLHYDSGPSTPDGRAHFPKMKWIEDKPELFSINTFLPPNVQLFGRIDNVHPFVMWPTSHATCRVICYHLFPKQYFDLPGFAEEARGYGAWVQMTLEEDKQMISSLQNSMESKRFVPGPMSNLEGLVHHIIKEYLAKAFGPRT
jgi:phenylpropionate dioxygenase-like ring-hydroxylating dioxygenase large terminal subunit